MSSTAKANTPTGAKTATAKRVSQRIINNEQKSIQETEYLSLEKAIKVLKSSSLVTTDDPPNITVLSSTLRYMAAHLKDKSKSACEILNALATYSEHLSFSKSASIVADAVTTLITPIIQQSTEAQESADPQALSRLQAQQKSDTEKIMNELSILSARIDKLPTVKEHAPVGTSYASIAANVQRGPPPPTAAYQNDIRARQIILEGYNVNDPATGKQIAENILLKKASVAFTLMGMAAEDAPRDKKENSPFKSAQVLRSGAIAYEMESRQMATWMKQPDVRTAFLEKYGGDTGTRIISRSYPVVVYYVPISFDPNMQQLQQLARENDIPYADVQEARWMKALSQRKEGQAVAHLRINLSSDVTANKLLRQGTLIEGRRLNTIKWIPDPKRCFKCQELNAGHIATECKAQNNTCGTCGAKSHCTQECSITDTSQFYCCNCKKNGHGTWARDCPAMLRTRARMLERQPEYRYVLYPVMGDPSTWEQISEPDHHFQTHDTHPAFGPRTNTRFNTQTRNTFVPHRPTGDQWHTANPKNRWSDEVERERPWEMRPRGNSEVKRVPAQHPSIPESPPLDFPSSSPFGTGANSPTPSASPLHLSALLPSTESTPASQTAHLPESSKPPAPVRVREPGELRQSTILDSYPRNQAQAPYGKGKGRKTPTTLR